MSAIQDSFARFYQIDVVANAARFAVGVLEAVIIVALVVFIGRRMQATWRSGRLAGRTNANIGILIGRLSYLTAIALGIIWIAYIFGVELNGLLTFLGAISLAITFAIQDVLKNLVAGLYLLWEQPFIIGDSIKVKDSTGTVEDVQIRTTVLRAENGELIVVPNGVLFTEIVINRRLGMPEAEAPAKSA
ncbi:MAG TPA: mechanosensitive ion channel domain-containing protein [Chloroflexota bacterium]|nr:mechanosensitive ion channel domain-containing protein [Chloroflexota bacterium]